MTNQLRRVSSFIRTLALTTSFRPPSLKFMNFGQSQALSQRPYLAPDWLHERLATNQRPVLIIDQNFDIDNTTQKFPPSVLERGPVQERRAADLCQLSEVVRGRSRGGGTLSKNGGRLLPQNVQQGIYKLMAR